jgi:Tfp pilus assembly protein PilV
VAAIAVGVLIAFLVVSLVIGFLIEAAIAALVVAVIVLPIKAAFYRNQLFVEKARQRGPRAQVQQSAARHDMRDVDDELARLEREMGG